MGEVWKGPGPGKGRAGRGKQTASVVQGETQANLSSEIGVRVQVRLQIFPVCKVFQAR